MTGGAGDDTFRVDNAGDVLAETAAGGIDTVLASGNYVLPVFLENLFLEGDAVANATGNSAANVIRGNGNDNILDGGSGIDTLMGGNGDDIYIVDNLSDVVIETNPDPLTGGVDWVHSYITIHTLTENVENMRLMGSNQVGNGNELGNYMVGSTSGSVVNSMGGDDTIEGSAAKDTFYGGDGNDLILGGGGSDYLEGNAGIDTLNGGAGDDYYRIDTQDIIIDESGIDHVYVLENYTLPNWAEHADLQGTAQQLTGNGSDNYLMGNASANTISGGAGSDILWGVGGNDALYGGDNNDILDGGDGDDLMVGGSGADAYYLHDAILGSGDTIYYEAGMDYIMVDATRFKLTRDPAVDIAAYGPGATNIDMSSARIVLAQESANQWALYYNANGSTAGLYSGAEGGRMATIITSGVGTPSLLINDQSPVG